MAVLCDFVLAFSDEREGGEEREEFERNLENAGLIVEREVVRGVTFVKLSVAQDVLFKYAEILKLQEPLKLDNQRSKLNEFRRKAKYLKEENKNQDVLYTFKDTFTNAKRFLFDENHPEFFDKNDRSLVVAYIVDNEPYQPVEPCKGIKNLLASGLYNAAFPLHDETVKAELLEEWATMNKSFYPQPITKIKNYFGTNIAVYFAWLGFYNRMMIFPAIISLIYIFYGLFTLPLDPLSNAICATDIYMCPSCDKYCLFWNLRKTCGYARMSYLIDNALTPYYCCFVSVWSVVQFQLWKRYNAQLIHKWGLHSFHIDDEPGRPEYCTWAVKKMRTLGASKQGIKVSVFTFSYSVVLFWMLLVFATTFGVLIYRISFSTSALLLAGTKFNKYFVDVTCSVIDVLCVYALEIAYQRMMVWLTEIELHRTQREYDNSLALKLFFFQFANRFSSVFYIAFLKGRLVGYPADYNRILGYRQEECQPGGCLTELSIQLLILILGMQILPHIVKTVKRFVIRVYKVCYLNATDDIDLDDKEAPKLIKDYNLCRASSEILFYDYLQIVIQFAYLTIFISAFPIAPLIAVFNNILELRLDAKKMLIRYQKVIPQRAKTIGIWAHMIETTYQIGVYSNSFILAFSTNFIPKTVFHYLYPDGSYLNYSLAIFAVKDFPAEFAPQDNSNNLTHCRYKEIRNPPDHEFPYMRPIDYWYILAARLAFMLLYQNLVLLIQKSVRLFLPDTPRSVMAMIRMESKIITETLIRKQRGITDDIEEDRRSRGSISRELIITEKKHGSEYIQVRTEDRTLPVADDAKKRFKSGASDVEKGNA